MKNNLFVWSMSVAGVAAAICLAIGIAGLANGFTLGGLLVTILVSYIAFSFVSLLFFEGAVQDVILYMFDKSIHWPGLIFELDLDGIIWFICVKLLFGILGFIFGALCGLLGILVAIVIAPFVFPFKIASIIHDMKLGVEIE